MIGNAATIGYLAAALTTVSFVPQVVRVMRTRDTQAISLVSYVAFCTGVFLWLVYGLVLANMPIVIANGTTLALAIVILLYKIRLG